MNDLFTIGEISKHQNISRQTLIFYDKIGLFRPAYVDPENGYRYYSAAQLDYLDTICIMKKFGFSLDEIKAHMKSYTLDTSLIALRKQLTIIDRQIKDLQLIKSRVAHRCTAGQRLQRGGRILQTACAAGFLPQQQLSEQRYSRQRRYSAAAEQNALHERTCCDQCHQHESNEDRWHRADLESDR